MSGRGTKAKPPRQARKLHPVVGRILVIDCCRVCFNCFLRAGLGVWKCVPENKVVPNPYTGIPRWCPLPKANTTGERP